MADYSKSSELASAGQSKRPLSIIEEDDSDTDEDEVETRSKGSSGKENEDITNSEIAVKTSVGDAGKTSDKGTSSTSEKSKQGVSRSSSFKAIKQFFVDKTEINNNKTTPETKASGRVKKTEQHQNSPSTPSRLAKSKPIELRVKIAPRTGTSASPKPHHTAHKRDGDSRQHGVLKDAQKAPSKGHSVSDTHSSAKSITSPSSSSLDQAGKSSPVAMPEVKHVKPSIPLYQRHTKSSSAYVSEKKNMLSKRDSFGKETKDSKPEHKQKEKLKAASKMKKYPSSDTLSTGKSKKSNDTENVLRDKPETNSTKSEIRRSSSEMDIHISDNSTEGDSKNSNSKLSVCSGAVDDVDNSSSSENNENARHSFTSSIIIACNEPPSGQSINSTNPNIVIEQQSPTDTSLPCVTLKVSIPDTGMNRTTLSSYDVLTNDASSKKSQPKWVTTNESASKEIPKDVQSSMQLSSSRPNQCLSKTSEFAQNNNIDIPTMQQSITKNGYAPRLSPNEKQSFAPDVSTLPSTNSIKEELSAGMNSNNSSLLSTSSSFSSSPSQSPSSSLKRTLSFSPKLRPKFRTSPTLGRRYTIDRSLHTGSLNIRRPSIPSVSITGCPVPNGSSDHQLKTTDESVNSDDNKLNGHLLDVSRLAARTSVPNPCVPGSPSLVLYRTARRGSYFFKRHQSTDSLSESESAETTSEEVSPVSPADLNRLKETTDRLRLSTRRASTLQWRQTYVEDTGLSRVPPDLNGGDASDDNLTVERKQKINSALEWLRNELQEMRTQDQALARQLLIIRQDIHQLKLQKCTEEHQILLDDFKTELEELDEFSDVLDLPHPIHYEDNPLKHIGITRHNINARRFSAC